MDIRNSLQSLQRIFETPGVSEAGGMTASRAGTQAAASAALPSDEASMSRAGSLVTQALSLPDVRMEKVISIQQALAANTYSVSASAVAGKLMQHMLLA